jgi:dTMP kinase
MAKALLIAIEGIDGVGKSTQCHRLSNWLTQRQIKNIQVKEPGATDFGLKLRDLLVGRTGGEISALEEMLLFEADRSHSYETLILPALREGTTVIKDRSIFGTLAYQGYAGGVPLDLIRTITGYATAGRQADWSFVLDLPVNEAEGRLRERRNQVVVDPFEAASPTHKEKVRQGYVSEAKANNSWCSIIDAGLSVDEIAALIRQRVDKLLESRDNPGSA